MRHKSRWLALLLALLMLLCGTVAARAVEDRRDCSITLLLGEGEEHLQNPLRGGKISLYYVAGVRFDGELGFDLSLGQFAAVTGLPAIAELTTQELDRQNASLSATLLAAAKEQGIAPMQVAAVTDGKVQFSELPVGLYLLTQTERSENGRSMKTFLLSVPDGSGAYDVVAAPKPGFQASAPEPVPASLPHGTNVRPNPTEETVGAFRSVEAEPIPEPDFSMPTMEIDGAPYVGLLSIPSVSLELPVAAQWSEEQLQTGPCAYCGSYYSDDLTVIGHNYRSQFRPLLDLPIGTELLLTTVNGEVLRYLVTNREIIAPTEVERLTGETGPDDWDLSLVTCTLGAQSRCVLRCVRSLGGA